MGNGVPDAVLVDLGTKSRWNIDQAMDEFYSKGYDQKYGGAPSMYSASGGGPANEGNI